MSPENNQSPQLIIDTLKIADSRPINVAEISAILPLMRQELPLNLSEAARESLSKSKFRDLTTGRGPGVVEALGVPRAVALMSWCQQRAEGGPRIGKKDGTEGRGLRQLAADTIQLLANPAPTEEEVEKFTLRLNQRVKKGLPKKLRGPFAGVPDISDAKKYRQFASVPSGSVKDLWDFLTAK